MVSRTCLECFPKALLEIREFYLVKTMNRKFTFEHLLYLAALVIALSYRLSGLGAFPLSEFEAGWAMQAYKLAEGQSVILGGEALYVILTSLLFDFFSSSAAIARLLPALAGSFLILLPWGVRKRIGALPALVLAFGLALDPGMVAVSRLAGGPMLAVFILLALMVSWMQGRPEWMGALLGLGLLAGSSFWFGYIGLLLSTLLLRLFSEERVEVEPGSWRKMGIAAGIVILLAGTFFLRFPGGLSALGGGLADLLSGWRVPSGVSVGQSMFTLAYYQPLVVAAALIVIVRAIIKQEAHKSTMIWWMLSALFLILAYPARQAYDLVWVLLPLWAIAAQGLAKLFENLDLRDGVVIGEAILTTIFLVFAWLVLASVLVQAVPEFFIIPVFGREITFQGIWVVPAVIVMAVVSAGLIGMGWNFPSAMRGLAAGFIVFLGFNMMATAWTASHLRERQVYDLWQPSPVAGVNDVLLETVENLSETSSGHKNRLEIVSLVDSVALEWLLREFPDFRSVTQLAPGEQPAIVIVTDDEDDVFLQTAYRGQSFALEFHRGWDSAVPPEILSWLVWRESVAYQKNIVVWARTDIFADGAAFPVP